MSDSQSIYTQLYDNMEFYRPPREEHSAFLEIAYGCSWAGCAFCDFIKDEFKVYSLKDVARKAQLLSQVMEGRTRIHFLGCNPLALPQDYLLDVFMLTRRYIPQATEYSMYARAEDVLEKGDAGLAALRRAGLTDVHMGIESGSDEVLAMHNKGETVSQMLDACHALERAGLACHISLIPGLGGRRLSAIHAQKTAEFLSQIHPASVWCIGLKIWEGTPLADMCRAGVFDPMDYREMLAELRDMAVDRSWIKTTVLFKMGQIGSDLGPFDRMEIFAGNRFFCPSDVFIEIGCIVCDGVGRQIPERKDVKMLLVEFSIVLIHRCRSS